MAITTEAIDKSAPYLLKLFEAEIERTLVKAAMEKIEEAHQQALKDIRPQVEAAAKEAVKGMETSLRAHYRPMEHDLIVGFIGKLPDGTIRTDIPGTTGGQ